MAALHARVTFRYDYHRSISVDNENSIMPIGLKAIDVAGTIDEERHLHLDAPLPIVGPSRVRVIILIPEETEIEEADWLRTAATNPAFSFLNDPAEDVYTLADGKPFHDQG